MKEPMREPSDFNEEAYLAAYPDVAAAVKDERVKSALEHYLDLRQMGGARAKG